MEERKVKTNTERIKRIFDITEDHFGKGTVKFVGLKFEPKYGFVAKVQFYKSNNNVFKNIFENSEDSTKALKKLKNRIKKIINRYNYV